MTDTRLPAPTAHTPEESFFAWRNMLARGLFRTIATISIPAFLAATYYAYDEGTYSYVAIYLALMVFMLAAAFWRRVTDAVRMFSLMGLIYFIVLMDFYTEGRGSLARAFMIVFGLMGAIFWGRRGAIISSVIAMLTMIAFAYLFVSQTLPDYQVSSTTLAGWISNMVIVAVLLALVAFSVNFLVREMTGNLERSRELNQTIEAERAALEQRVAERTAAAEAARAEAELARLEAEAQAWYTRGQAQLAEKMRGNQDISTLANNATAFLCQYLGAHTGALYLVSGKSLKLAGGYAYAAHSKRKDEFGINETLTGEVARANQQLKLFTMLDDALLVSSALGEAKPKQALISPLAADEKVVGVIELATLNEFSGEHELFMRRVSESIAVAFRAAQSRLQVDDLLVQLTRQAEELQAQERELRVANEELQAQADDFHSVLDKEHKRQAQS